MAPTVSYFLLKLLLNIQTRNCFECLTENGIYCLDDGNCMRGNLTNQSDSECQKPVDNLLNCPWLPPPEFAYDENFTRNQVFPMVVAAMSPLTEKCLENNIPTMKLYKKRTAVCSISDPEVVCSAYTAYDISQKAIVMSFRGTAGVKQGQQLRRDIVERGTRQFLTKGRVFQVFYDNFLSLWNSGIGEDFLHLKGLFPDFELWITGHSMGGSIALVASAYLVETQQFEANKMKIVLLGCPRVGDYHFAAWHSFTFPYSYHIIHARDYTPRVPEYDPTTNITAYHPKTEVWYDNSMEEGADYVICEQADQPFCGSVIPLSNLTDADHQTYFNVDMVKWASQGCPRDLENFKLLKK